MSVRKIDNIYNSVINETSFSRVHPVLKESGISNFIQMTSSEELLKLMLEPSGSVPEDLKNSDDFYETIAYLFQSFTNIGYTTYEIVNFIVEALKKSQLNRNRPEILKFLNESICIVHADYDKKFKNAKDKKVLENILFGHSDTDYFNMGMYLSSANSSSVIRNFMDKKYKKEIKCLSAFTDLDLPPSALAKKQTDQQRMEKKFNSSNLNKDIASPSKLEPSVSSIVITNPKMRVGTQNNLELSTFFNGFTNLELNRSYPYLNATFILPTLTKSEDNKNTNGYNSSTIGNYLFASTLKKTPMYQKLNGDLEDPANGLIRANMSLFTTPQTMVNMNERGGHTQNQKTNRNIIDPAQPFMTIKSFSINSSATKGLMSYKSGKLSVVLHDRGRMKEIAPFVKPDLFGIFGAEIVLEYGWSNPDQNNTRNPLGFFIGNSKIVEKYMIVNSSMSIDNTGLVNIELSIAMKGPYIFKNQQMSTIISNRVNKQYLKNMVASIHDSRQQLNVSELEQTLFEQIGLKEVNLNNIFNETTKISSPNIQIINEFILNHMFLKKFKDLSTINASSVIENSVKKVKFKIPIDKFLDSTRKKHNDNADMLLSLISPKTKNWGFDSQTNQYVFTIPTDLNLSDAWNKFKLIINQTLNLLEILNQISEEDQKEQGKRSLILQRIMGALDYIDFFYPTDQTSLNNIPASQNSVDPDYYNYISLGSIINTIVQVYVANVDENKKSQFDEIQTVFYTANKNAGAMSHRPLSSILISKTLLADLITNIFSKKAIVTPESLITQIIKNCVQVSDNISYGLVNLYETRKNAKDPLKIKKRIVDTNSFEASKNIILKKIYFGNNLQINNSEFKFTPPVIHKNFDCFTSGKIDKERTILRISIYDKVDTPFEASSTLLERLYSGEVNNVLRNINKKRIDTLCKKTSKAKNITVGKSTGKNNLKYQNFIDYKKNEVDKLVKKNILIKNKKDGSLSFNYKQLQENLLFKGKVKDMFKQKYPSLTLGTQNTALISATVSTVNDNKLSTIFMTRPDRNDNVLINNRNNQNTLPLRILPTQAQVEIIGCPWVNFGQSVFLDFNTGTTIDNKYVITGITHNLQPGKFTTSLTLSYGDNYGQFESTLDAFNITDPSYKEKTNNLEVVGETQESNLIIIDKDYKTQNWEKGGFFKDNLVIKV